MLEILKYTFFQNALIGGILIALISSILGVFVVMRKEANITHAISNFLFLGISVSLFLDGNYYFFAFLFGIIGSLFLFFIEKSKFINNESSKEIIAQTGLAGAIFTIGFLKNLTLDINNLLFGSILSVNKFDIFSLFVLFLIIYAIFFIFGKNFLAIIINEEIAKTKEIKTDLYNFIFLFLLSIFIAISIKIFGIMLVGAFLVIPSNSAKIISKSVKQVFIFSVIFAVFGVIFGLFSSYFLDTSASASIILVQIILFILCFWVKKVRKD